MCIISVLGELNLYKTKQHKNRGVGNAVCLACDAVASMATYVSTMAT